MRNRLRKQKENGLADSKLARVSIEARHPRSLGNGRGPRGRRCPLRGPVPPCAARRPCSEAFTPSRAAGAEEAGPEHLCQAGSHRGQEEGTGRGEGGSGKDPIAFLGPDTQEAAKRPALPAPTSPQPPSTFTDLAAHAWPQPQLTASAHSLCGMRAAQTSPPGPTPAASPFLVWVAQAEERAELSQSPSTGERT